MMRAKWTIRERGKIWKPGEEISGLSASQEDRLVALGAAERFEADGETSPTVNLEEAEEEPGRVPESEAGSRSSRRSGRRSRS